MALAEQITAHVNGVWYKVPVTIRDPLERNLEDFKATYQPSSAIQVGDVFPSFNLKNAVGEEVSRDNLLSKGPFLVTFYRGEWCPFCNMVVAALQARLGGFKAKGVTLVAISPELPNGNLTMTEKHQLKFPVLSDLGNELARKLGIIFQVSDAARPVYDKWSIDLKTCNGDDSFEIPVPATFLVDGEGTVRNAYVDGDYTKRIEPSVAVEWVNALQTDSIHWFLLVLHGGDTDEIVSMQRRHSASMTSTEKLIHPSYPKAHTRKLNVSTGMTNVQ